MIKAALNGELNNVEYRTDPIFKFEVPTKCPNIPNAVLNPRDTWANEEDYDKTANKLADLFVSNFKKYADQANEDILSAAPITK